MSVTVKNETPYCFSYCFSCLPFPTFNWAHGVVQPWSTKSISHTRFFDPIYVKAGFFNRIYLKYGQHSEQDTLQHADLHQVFWRFLHPTVYIREYGADRSLLQLTCNKGGDSPTCPNYGKQEEDRKEKERRKLQEEERRQQQIERERRIQEEIEKESKALEEKQAQFNKELKMRINKGLQRQEQSQILHHIVENAALPIQTTEVTLYTVCTTYIIYSILTVLFNSDIL
ncbi:uncharacterized protein [Aquarana catesbeiana]|uniref:uncharacterized protein n=1 Tax=Aquarana catesbeiana TaxID=8400 RepID=UPI003CC97BD5